MSKQRRAGRDDSGEVQGHPAGFLRTLGEMGSPDDGQDGRRSFGCHQKGRPVAVVGVKPGSPGPPRWTALCMSGVQSAGDLSRLHGIVRVPGLGYDDWV